MNSAPATTHKDPNYTIIFVWLIALTVFEVGITYLDLAKSVLAPLLIASSVAKALLVALYFMHLRHEVRLIVMTVIVCLVLSGVYVLGLFPDIVFGG
jgi:cytochrome c oxidase subunit 4